MIHSKPFIKAIGILLLIVSIVEIWDQTIVQIIRKNKSTLMSLINSNNFFTDTHINPTSKMKLFVALVRSLQPSNNVTKYTILELTNLCTQSAISSI